MRFEELRWYVTGAGYRPRENAICQVWHANVYTIYQVNMHALIYIGMSCCDDNQTDPRSAGSTSPSSLAASAHAMLSQLRLAALALAAFRAARTEDMDGATEA